MADALANALKRKEELERELAEINQFVSLYQRFSGGAEPERRDMLSPPVDDGESTRGHIAIRSKRVLGTGAVSKLTEGMLRERGLPMTRSQIVEALEHRNYYIPSGDKARYIGTILWRNRDRFVNLPGQGYWLRGVPNATAGYDPSDPNSLVALRELAQGDEPPDTD